MKRPRLIRLRRMHIHAEALTAVLGFVLLVAGVALVLSVGYALIVAGLLLLAGSVLR